ncbi:MAG: DUF2088 domain-containing protein, partial [Acidimicrobiia bacterium]|nr:DUF2088 domain-containing protein [Acidimicrobiia bacterium]
NGKVFPMSDSDISQKLGDENLARMERLGIGFFQNEPRNTDNYSYVGVSSRGTPVWLHNEVARSEIIFTIGHAQANHWGAGGGGKLILPGVVSDETVESNHCAFVPSPQTHYGAYAGPMRADIDETATMCGLSATMNVLLDTRGRVIDCIYGAHPDAHVEAIDRFNAIYAYDNPVAEAGPADIAVCGVFAPTDHLFFHTGWGCMSSDLVVREGGTIIYCSPSPGVSTAIGDFPGLALMDLMKPYMPPTPENYEKVLRDIHPDVGRLHLGAHLRGHDPQAPHDGHPGGEPGHGRRHRPRRHHQPRRRLRGGHGAPRPRRQGDRAALRPLPAAPQRHPHARRGGAGARAGAPLNPPGASVTVRGVNGRGTAGPVGPPADAREIKGKTTVVEVLRMFPDGEAARLMSRLSWPCAHCGGAFHEPLAVAAKRHRNSPIAVLEAFRALCTPDGPSDELVQRAAVKSTDR